MKFCAVAAVLFVSLFASSLAVPAYKRVAYYQQPQRMMVLQQYVQHPRTQARSAAYVAGESVAAGSVLKDCVHPEDAASVEQQAAQESVLNDAGINEDGAYPAAGGQVSAEFEGTFSDSAGAGVSDAAVSDIGVSNAGVPDAGVSDAGVSDAGVSGAGFSGAGFSGAVDVPAVEIPASAEVPEAPVADNQVLEDDSAPAVPEVVPAAEESDHDSKVPREYNFEVTAQVVPEVPVETPVAEEAVPQIPAIPELPSLSPEQAPVEEAPVAAAEVPLTAAAPAVSVVVPVVTPVAVAPPKRYLPPRRKVTVKLDEQSEVASDDDDVDADSYRPARIPNARRPVKKGSGNAVAAKGTKAQLPAGTFFPINFGGTSGGAIAIANSFSTGEGGSATSHAIAYGSPDAARTKSRPVRRH